MRFGAISSSGLGGDIVEEPLTYAQTSLDHKRSPRTYGSGELKAFSLNLINQC